MILLLTMIPLLGMGQWKWAITTGLACLVSALCNAMDEIDDTEKKEIRYNVMEAEDVLAELFEYAGHEDRGLIFVTGLASLAQKYSRQSTLVAATTTRPGERDLTIPSLTSSLSCNNGVTRSSPYPISKRNSSRIRWDVTTHEECNPAQIRLQQMALLCQEAAYLGLVVGPDQDQLVASSLSLLALVAGQENVRYRHLHEADKYGLNIPIQCMKQALERAKDRPEADHETEVNDDTPIDNSKNGVSQGKNLFSASPALTAAQQSAELQRKGCLLLGALADGDSEMARLVAQEGGIEMVLQAISWYRYHADVANWGLWAIFILAYEYTPNKALIIGAGGVAVVTQALRLCGCETIEVARHGIAILFDLLREQDPDDVPRLDTWKVRNAALAAGIHSPMLVAMNTYARAMDIIMMGQAILAGTDYKGEVPQYDPAG